MWAFPPDSTSLFAHVHKLEKFHLRYRKSSPSKQNNTYLLHIRREGKIPALIFSQFYTTQRPQPHSDSKVIHCKSVVEVNIFHGELFLLLILDSHAMEKDEIFKSIQKYCFPKTEYQVSDWKNVRKFRKCGEVMSAQKNSHLNSMVNHRSEVSR